MLSWTWVALWSVGAVIWGDCLGGSAPLAIRTASGTRRQLRHYDDAEGGGWGEREGHGSNIVPSCRSTEGKSEPRRAPELQCPTECLFMPAHLDLSTRRDTAGTERAESRDTQRLNATFKAAKMTALGDTHTSRLVKRGTREAPKHALKSIHTQCSQLALH